MRTHFACLLPLLLLLLLQVVDPTGTKADGRCVRYGDVIVLMDQRGYTLNNKTGGRTGYVDMKYVL
jgi:hypothetical protein